MVGCAMDVDNYRIHYCGREDYGKGQLGAGGASFSINAVAGQTIQTVPQASLNRIQFHTNFPSAAQGVGRLRGGVV